VTSPASAQDGYAFRVEVTVTACIESPDHQVVGDNIADITLVFSRAVGDPPAEDLTDPIVQASLAHNMSPILGVIQATLTQIGLRYLGTVEETLSERGRTVVGHIRSSPVRVQLYTPMPGSEGVQ
jgi:hypothetical protein